MALSKSENEYQPLATIQVKITSEGMMWRMRDGKPAVDSLDELCKWLFSCLINETKRVIREEALEQPGGFEEKTPP